MDQFIGQLQQKMQEFRIGVLRVEDVDEASGKIILTVSEADAAMLPAEKNASGQHCVLTQTTKTSPGFLLILQEHRERFFPVISQREADASLSTELGDSITPTSDAAVDDEADSSVVELLLTALLAELLPPPPGSCEGKSFP